MSQTIVTPPLSHQVRRALARMWDEPESRSMVIGIVGTILVHLLLLFVGPFLLRTDPSQMLAPRPHARPQQFNIDLAPDMYKPPAKPVQPKNFVETNPDAPDNAPDKTDNFAARNQQVAQEKPSPKNESEKPKMEGQTEIKSNQIVTGQLVKPQESTPPVPPSPVTPNDSKLVAPRQEQVPLSGFDKKTGIDTNGYGTNIANPSEAPKDVPEKVDGMKNVPLIEGATDMQRAVDPRHPRPRPQVVKTQQTRPAIFEENKLGTMNVGLRGINAQWSNYGAYLQKMVEIVQTQFDKLNYASRFSAAPGTLTTVKFTLDSEGNILIVSVDSSKGSETAARISVSSITIPAPYGPWTDDMKAMLGEKQEMTYDFYYR